MVASRIVDASTHYVVRAHGWLLLMRASLCTSYPSNGQQVVKTSKLSLPAAFLVLNTVVLAYCCHSLSNAVSYLVLLLLACCCFLLACCCFLLACCCCCRLLAAAVSLAAAAVACLLNTVACFLLLSLSCLLNVQMGPIHLDHHQVS